MEHRAPKLRLAFLQGEPSHHAWESLPVFVNMQIPGPHPHLLELESLGTRRWNLHFIQIAQGHVILTALFSSLRHRWTMNWNEGPAWCRETSQGWGGRAKEAGGGLVPPKTYTQGAHKSPGASSGSTSWFPASTLPRNRQCSSVPLLMNKRQPRNGQMGHCPEAEEGSSQKPTGI